MGPKQIDRDGCYLTKFVFFSSRRRHTRFDCDWSSDVCSSDLFQRISCTGQIVGFLKCLPCFESRGGIIRANFARGFQMRRSFCILSRLQLQFADLRSEEHTSELQSQSNLVCRLLLEKKKQVS